MITCLVTIIAVISAIGVYSLTQSGSWALGTFFGIVGAAFLLSVMQEGKQRADWRSNEEIRKLYYKDGFSPPHPNYEVPYETPLNQRKWVNQTKPPEHPELRAHNPSKPTMGYWEIRRSAKSLIVRTIRNTVHSNYNGRFDDLLEQQRNKAMNSKDFTREEKDNIHAIVDEAIRVIRDIEGRGPPRGSEYNKPWEENDRYK